MDRTYALTERLVDTTLGTVVRPRRMLAAAYHEDPLSLAAQDPWRNMFATSPEGTDLGYAVLRRVHSFQNGLPSGTARVPELVGTPAARLALVRRLLSLDLIATVEIGRAAVEEDLLRWAGHPRDAATGARDNVWIRLVNLPTAPVSSPSTEPVGSGSWTT